MPDSVLQVVLVVFMLFLCLLCLFAVVVIVRDILRESAQARREREEQQRCCQAIRQQPSASLPASTAQTELPQGDAPNAPQAPLPVADDVMAQVAATQSVTTADDANAVTFSRANLTLQDKYSALSTEFKRYFDDIVKHVLSKDGIKENKKDDSVSYKIGSYKVLKLTVKRGEITCSFHFINHNFNTYAADTNVKVKQAATVVRVLDAPSVGVVKDGVDLVCRQIEQDKVRKRALANEKRRQKRHDLKGQDSPAPQPPQ